MSSSLCTLSTCDVSESPYGFRSSLTTSAIFATVSAVCLVINGAVAARSARRQHTATPFSVIVTLACVLEMLGWVDRMAGWRDPWAVYPFMQSKALLTVAPVLVTSSIYVCLAPMVRILGTEHSFVKPELYTVILLPLDGLALLLQVAGLAVGFRNVPYTLASGDSYAPDAAGARIVLAGLALQLATLVATGLFLASVLLRAARAHHRYGYTTFHRDVGYVPLTGRFRIFAGAVPSAMLVLFGRLCFRVAEYAEGWGGPLAMGGEGLFVGLEGFLVCYALLAIVGCHPALFLKDGKMVSRIEAEPFVGIHVTGSVGQGAEHERDMEEMSKVYQRHHEEERRLSRLDQV
ncbi:sphingoid long-chain base transporter RSB1 [Colletotrichum graminicola]|uniref:Sphingoid long-chain base transporter RSB1 n=1 Tax=Colletotrichum graminicola (strain M1.001 / M2 / FGSC 10212) TaxID=645133 RepID=E3Q5U8_COLGM|nr:sphingoid long-chain base transporter RSB1 [Colletotrichum graminicola M1.001]EFQ26196.1 sphingoid long-chain base transporter RSB1 [Colletotrichum graminicola M1.001]WDK13976.1 sphingoid long-chain base transporter RSB1 [Colletotrichum graminicola]